MVGWAAYPASALVVSKGAPRVYASSEHGRRHFCGECGTGLFYTNETVLPGIVDVQSATYDDPDALPPPKAHVQVAERVAWMAHAHDVPMFARYPPTPE